MAASRGLPQGEDSAASGSYRPLHRPLTLGCSSTSRLPPRALGGTHTRMPNTHATIWRILTSLPIQSSGSQARRPSPGLSNQSAFVTRFPKVIGLGCQVGVATFISRADNWLINVQPMARESREHRASVRNHSEASLTCEQWKLSTEKDTEVGQYVKNCPSGHNNPNSVFVEVCVPPFPHQRKTNKGHLVVS